MPKISITFDDLPCDNIELPLNEVIDINNKILNVLSSLNILTVGFVNECKLYIADETDKRIMVLQNWIDQGHELANHTYSHCSLDETSLEDFQNEVLLGQKVISLIMKAAGKKLRYFRYPYLITGKNKELRIAFETFLKAYHYISAPVTIVTGDWMFNQAYIKVKKSDSAQAKKIIENYLDFTTAKFNFYEKTTHQLFGRDIRHIWLLHTNHINADCLDDLLKLISERNYDFISLKDALEDKVYKLTDNYYGGLGMGWLFRWDVSNKSIIDWKQEPNYKDFLN